MYKLEVPPPVGKDKNVVLDIEMFGQDVSRLHRPHGRLASVQIGIGNDVYIVTDVEDAKKAIARISGANLWIGHNLKYDITQLRGLGIDIPQRKVWDTYLMERNLWNGMYMDWGLDDLARRYLSIKLDKTTRDEFATATEMTPEMMHYAAKDVVITGQIQKAQEALIAIEKRNVSAYWNIDEPTMWVIMDMPPVLVDKEGWMEMVEEFKERATICEADLGINTYSHIQVKQYIYEKLHRMLSDTQDETLAKLDDPEVEKIREARMYRKATSTYGERWLEEWVESGNLVYANFNTIGTETFRMSSSDPNLQQIPSRKLPKYREMFISMHGVLVIADISQQEPRILAEITGDKELRGIFNRGEDIHLMIARAVYHDDTLTKEDKEKRFTGKTIGLGTSYGLTAPGLAERTGMSEDEAQDILDAYFTQFKDVGIWIDRQRRFAKEHGYINTLGGHRIYINPYDSQADNNAINAPIQGTAADFTKMWMIGLHRMCKEAGLPFPMCLVVHDELVLDVPKDKVGVYTVMLNESMNDVAKDLCPNVPFKSDVSSGPTWASKE